MSEADQPSNRAGIERSGATAWKAKAAALFLVALGVRIFTAGWGGLSCDEANCANIAAASTWDQVFEHIKLDGNAPLIYVVLKLWGTLFGGGDLSLRIFAVLSGSLLAPTAYLVLRKQLGESLSVTTAALMAFCAPLVQFGNLVRPYAWLPILSLLSTFMLMRLLDSPRNTLNVFAYAATLAALVYVHHWGAMVAAGQAVMVTAGLARGQWQKEQILSWLAGLGVALTLYAPWLPVLAFGLTNDVSPWITAPAWQALLFLMPVEAVSGYREKPEWLALAVTIWANLAVWASLLLPACMQTAQQSQPPFPVRRWQLATGSGLLVALVVSQFRPFWRDRYLMAFTPLLLVLYAVVSTRFARRLPRKLAAVVPVALWLPVWLPQLVFFHAFPESSAWAVMEQLAGQCRPATDLVVVSFEAIAPQVDRYLPAAVPVVSFPDLERISVIPWAGINKRIRQSDRLDRLLELMRDRLDSGGRVWLVESYHKYLPMPLNYPIHRLSFNAVEAVRMCQIRAWLDSHAKKEGKDLWAPGREFSVMAGCYRKAD